MGKIQSCLGFLKKPRVILGLIVLIFFLKGLFVAVLFSIFTGQDEARHYNTIQYMSEPKEKTWEVVEQKPISNKKSILQYSFSEEIINAGAASNYDIIRRELFDTIKFSSDYKGQNEIEIEEKKWRPYNLLDPPDIAGGKKNKSLYHHLGSLIEKNFQQNNILIRFYLIRIFSISLASLAVLLSYFIAKNSGLKEKYSLIITAIIAFQPKFTMYTTNINYDSLLIFTFFLFTLGGILSLRNGLHWKNLSVLIISILLAILTKGTGLVLVGVFILLLSFHAWSFFQNKKLALWKKIALFASPLFFLFTFIHFFTRYKLLRILSPEDGLASVIKYLEDGLTAGRIGLSSRTYWGILSWKDNFIIENLTDFIWGLTILATIGIILFFFSKKKLPFLPEKKYIAFLALMIAGLQLGIRFYDWKIFARTGSFDLGAPGRYFLPNLASHIILLFVGLGYLLKKEKHFKTILLLGLIGIFIFAFYTIFNVVLPRYYL